MADEPTWEDLFGSADPVTPQQPQPVQPVQPQPAAQQPAATAPAAPVQPPTGGHSAPVFGAPTQLPPAQAAPAYRAPSVAQQPTAQQPTAQQPTIQQPVAQQPIAAHPAQPTYVSQLAAAPAAATHTPPPVEPPRRGGTDDGGRGRGGRPGAPKRRRRLTWLWVLLVLLALGAAGVGVVYSAFGPQIRHVMGWEPSLDYTSTTGNGQTTTITILPGQIGADVAKSLSKAGVTKTTAAFYDLLLKQKKAPVLEPGTYKLGKQISAKAALTEISDPTNRVVSKVVIPEGFNLAQILARINSKTGIPLSQLQAEAKNYTQFGVPAAFPSLEGYLFPATYSFDPGTSAKAMLQAMVTRMTQSLTSHGVAPADDLKVLTLASVIQKESGTSSDDYKVSRVFTNRIAVGMPLQSDATVSYGAGSKTIATTPAQRADASNLYNTYAHAGLPVGPIASPGDTAIDAALHPVAGAWIYFVLVNGDTGETVFSTTAAGQAAGVKQWQAWLKAHPGYGS